MKTGFYALGRLKTGQLNKTEKAYEEKLKFMMVRGEILWYKFEGMKFRLADKTFYTPDFAVMFKCGNIELHEVKGFAMDDSLVKLKVAAEMYPFEFLLVKVRLKRDGGGWNITRVGNGN